MSLGQIGLLVVGSWIAARLLFLTSLPFPIVLLLAGILTGAVGTLLGLPALRLSGLHLALITLMFAGLVTIVMPSIEFPNGGGGVLGHTESSLGSVAVRRPSIAASDDAYYRYAVVVAAIMFLVALAHVASKAGRAWAAIRQSEPAALAAGVNITLYKLWAFALASFMTGVAGGLLASDVGQLYSIQFRTIDSVTLLAVVLMGGIYSLWGAALAGILQQLLPALLNDWFGFFQRNPDFVLVLFGIGILQVLVTAPEGLVTQVPKDLRKPRPARLAPGDAALRRRRRGEREAGMIEVEGLTVRFGGVTPLDDMTVSFPAGNVRADRPERRGEDDVLQRPERVRQAANGRGAGVRRGPPAHDRLQAGALGAQAHVPAGAGDPAPLRVRERGHDPRALRRNRASRAEAVRTRSPSSASSRSCRTGSAALG